MDETQATLRIGRMLETERVVWLSTVRPDGTPNVLPIWFSWDGDSVLIASKPHARKVANIRVNPQVMLALGEPDEDFDVGLVEAAAREQRHQSRDRGLYQMDVGGLDRLEKPRRQSNCDAVAIPYALAPAGHEGNMPRLGQRLAAGRAP